MMRRWIALAGAVALTAPANAHDGHGLDGAHWHATDAFGVAAVVAAIAFVLWLRRK